MMTTINLFIKIATADGGKVTLSNEESKMLLTMLKDKLTKKTEQTQTPVVEKIENLSWEVTALSKRLRGWVSANGNNGKPVFVDKEVFEEAIERLGIPLDEAVAVGKSWKRIRKLKEGYKIMPLKYAVKATLRNGGAGMKPVELATAIGATPSGVHRALNK